MDVPGNRLFVTHMDHVLVLDLKTQAVVGTLDSSRAHGVAFAPELHRGFISNGNSDSVTIFDLQTLTPVGTVPTGKNPDAIVYDPATQRVIAFNGRENSATIFEAATGKIAGQLALPGRPEFAQATARALSSTISRTKGRC